MNSFRKQIALAAFLMALSVALGAFGAHGLKQILSADKVLTFDTAVRYQLYHSFALFIVVFLMFYFEKHVQILKKAYHLFFIGILIFSGSLYALTTCYAMHIENMKWLGAITPIGGLCFIAGWLLVTFAMLKKQ